MSRPDRTRRTRDVLELVGLDTLSTPPTCRPLRRPAPACGTCPLSLPCRPVSCCWTNRSPTLMCICGQHWKRNSPASIAAPVPPCSTSPTTSPKLWRWQTGWPSWTRAGSPSSRRPSTLYLEPTNEMVAGFIGEGKLMDVSNLTPGNDGRAHAHLFGQPIRLRCAEDARARSEARISFPSPPTCRWPTLVSAFRPPSSASPIAAII